MAGFSYSDWKKQQTAQSAAPASSQRTSRPPPKRTNVGNAFWINPYGKILDIGHAKHISAMIQSPEKFGLSIEEIQDAHKRHGESIGIEGKAREELIKDAMQRGFIHIRLYPNKFWAVNVWNYDRRSKKALSTWAENAMNHSSGGRHMPVRIYSLKNNQIVAQTTVQELYHGMSESISDYNPMFVESVADFESLIRPTFVDFLTAS